MTTTLVTGADGVSGRSLVALLEREGEECLWLTDLELEPGGGKRCCDLTDAAAVAALVAEVAPQRIYHLAGGYFPDYEANYRLNVLTTKHLLDACLLHGLRTRVLLVGSAAEYGAVRLEENPVREDHPLSAVNWYGLSKIFQTELMKLYHRLHALDLVMARPFNLLGEGFSSRLFIGNLLRQIAEYKQGTIAQIVVGNLESQRDYLPVEEAVRYYRRIMERGVAGEVYNVGSGMPVKIGDLLTRIIAEHGIGEAVVVCRESGGRPGIDVPCIYADNAKLLSL